MSGGDGFWHPLPTGGGGGGSALLAVVAYRPVGDTIHSATTSFADVNAANLVVTFTAPASGNVLVGLNGRVVAAASSEQYWNLRTPAGVNVTNSDALVHFGNAGVNVQPRLFHRIHLTGLTPGVSYTYRWGVKSSAAGSGSPLRYGSVSGAAVMEVWSA